MTMVEMFLVYIKFGSEDLEKEDQGEQKRKSSARRVSASPQSFDSLSNEIIKKGGRFFQRAISLNIGHIRSPYIFSHIGQRSSFMCIWFGVKQRGFGCSQIQPIC